jgi:hypothetical protein
MVESGSAKNLANSRFGVTYVKGYGKGMFRVITQTFVPEPQLEAWRCPQAMHTGTESDRC